MKPATRFYRDPKVTTWLAVQESWEELVYRIALKDENRDPAAAVDWNLRITTLRRKARPVDVPSQS
jgi:hypothetical protein